MSEAQQQAGAARTDTFAYDPLSIFLHWSVGLLIVYQMFFPPEIEGLGIEVRAPLVTTHTGLGLIILVLVALRVAWRLVRGPAPEVPQTPEWQNRAARFVHNAFYVLIVLTPLLGFLSTFSAPYEIAPFDMFVLNAGESEETWAFAVPSNIHKQCSRIMIGLFAVHVLAALYHYFVVKDGVLQRMLPFLPRRA